MDADLKTEGPLVAGQPRPFTSLSDGTQDQLATLLRLCIAEQLGHTIVLDDHLSQSDPDKIAWFRHQLRASSEKIQIILITCRPHDYLSEDQFVPAGQLHHHDSLDGALRAVNLGRAIKRYRLESDSP